MHPESDKQIKTLKNERTTNDSRLFFEWGIKVSGLFCLVISESTLNVVWARVDISCYIDSNLWMCRYLILTHFMRYRCFFLLHHLQLNTHNLRNGVKFFMNSHFLFTLSSKSNILFFSLTKFYHFQNTNPNFNC